VGQIIQLPVAAVRYPDPPGDLEPAECALLIAIRWWVDAHRGGDNPMPRPQQGLAMGRARTAASSIDAVIAIIARTVQRLVAVRCPPCPHLSGDEKGPLHAASLPQAGDDRLAERALRVALLSAHGAEALPGLLEGLGERLAHAQLLLRRRPTPFGNPLILDTQETWPPSRLSATIH